MRLISNLFSKINSFFGQGHERSIKAKKNILGIFIRKGLSFGISFLFIPLTIDYLNPTRYGVWLTVSSFVTWFSLFDIGLGNGLRNRFAEAVAKKDYELAKIYVSTTYAILTIISIALFLFFFFVYHFVDWASVFNVPITYKDELLQIILIVFAFFCFQFVFRIISTILTADQRPAIAGYFNTISSLLALILVFVLTKTTQGSLIYLAWAICFANLIIPLIATFWFFNKEYRYVSPSIRTINFKYTKDLLTLGIKFFIIQIAAMVIYTTSNFIISKLYGPEQVTPYNISYKLFSVSNMIFAIILTPFWSAFTEAYTLEDFDWIKRSVKKLFILWIITSIGTLVILTFSGFIFRIWVGDRVEISFYISLANAVFFILLNWNTIYVTFQNGVGKVKIQMYSAILEGLLYIPIAVFLAKYMGMGIPGIIVASTIPLIIFSVISFIQYKKIIDNRATGIWNQ